MHEKSTAIKRMKLAIILNMIKLKLITVSLVQNIKHRKVVVVVVGLSPIFRLWDLGLYVECPPWGSL